MINLYYFKNVQYTIVSFYFVIDLRIFRTMLAIIFPLPFPLQGAEVEDFDADAMYFPPAVVLHRCDKSVGCCTRPGYTCAPAKTEDVTVQFRVFSVNKMHTIEEFSFVNHTSCECESSDYAETIIKDSANSIRLSTLF